MDEKERFVILAGTGHFTISGLCRDLGISRKTGHKYLERYRREGRAGLEEYSRRPKSISGGDTRAGRGAGAQGKAQTPDLGTEEGA